MQELHKKVSYFYWDMVVVSITTVFTQKTTNKFNKVV